jgi:hypothetical protein
MTRRLANQNSSRQYAGYQTRGLSRRGRLNSLSSAVPLIRRCDPKNAFLARKTVNSCPWSTERALSANGHAASSESAEAGSHYDGALGASYQQAVRPVGNSATPVAGIT